MTDRIRIVSDIHLGHKASVLSELKELRPLSENVDWLIFNGDTLELAYGHSDQILLKQFEQETKNWSCKVSLITGNHDPAISDLHFLQILDGQVLITHGDGLFAEIAPWSSKIDIIRKFASGIDPDATGNGEADLHAYLAQNKEVSILTSQSDEDYNPTVWGKLKIFLHQAWPPSRPFKILKCWAEVPSRARSLASRFGLKPKFIIVGHTHKPGTWIQDEQVVINLGSFLPWPGSQCVDIIDSTLSVRKILKKQNRISIGEEIASFPLERTPSEADRPERVGSKL